MGGLLGGAGVSGGAPGGGYFAGGGHYGENGHKKALQDLAQYRDSAAQKSKDKLIRQLAVALKDTGIQVDPDSDTDSLLKALANAVPDPRKGKSFAADATAHREICNRLATALNSAFMSQGGPLIDKSLTPVQICRQVSEIIHGLATGMHSEFLAVHTSARRALRNLEVTMELMDKSYAQLTSQLAKNKSLPDTAEAQLMDNIYKRARTHANRQVVVLKNLIKVTLSDADKELQLALEDEGETHDLVMNIVGLSDRDLEDPKQTSDALALVFTKLVNLGAVVNTVNKSIKVLGLSANQYLDVNGKDLDKLLIDAEKANKSGAKAGDMIEAAQTLRGHFSTTRREEVQKEILERADNVAQAGGALADAPKLTKLERDLKREVTSRGLIMKEFVDRMANHKKGFLGIVSVLGPELGKRVQGSEILNNLVDSLEAWSSAEEEAKVGLDWQLVGYDNREAAKVAKTAYINRLRRIAGILGELKEMEMYRSNGFEHFSKLHASIMEMLDTIDQFTGVIREKYGGADETEDDLQKRMESLRSTVSRSALDIKRAANEMKYYMYIARAKSSIKNASGEISKFGEQYQELLAMAIGYRRSQVNKITTNWIKLVETALKPGDLLNAAGKAKAGDADTAKARHTELLKRTKGAIDAQLKAKHNFYKTLEALDIYMKQFTDAIVSNPDDVSKIREMLDDTEVIAKWYSDTTGDKLAEAFERTPASKITGGGVIDTGAAPVSRSIDKTTSDALVTGIKGGYFKMIATQISGGPGDFAPGIPTLYQPFVPDVAGVTANLTNNHDNIRKNIDEVLETFQALKNIINVFARVGEKFGGAGIKAPMSPTQIWRHLVNYLKESAISIAGPTGAVAMWELFPWNSDEKGYDFPDGNNIGSDQDVSGMPPFTTVKTAAKATANIYYDDDGAPEAGPKAIVINATDPTLINGNENHQRALGCFCFSNYGDFKLDSDAKSGSNYKTEDFLFSIAIKSIVAKVLTVLGTHNMIERPGSLSAMVPTRIALGGGSAAEAIPEAAELYYRLPRLVRFYKRFFGATGTDADTFAYTALDGSDKLALVLVPDFDGVFTPLIQYMFMRDGSVGTFSKYEAERMIEIINQIYNHYREADNPVRAAIDALIVEVNRRYSLIKKKDWDRYKELLMRFKGKAPEGARGQSLNFSILPDEDSIEVEGVSASDTFVSKLDKGTDEDPTFAVSARYRLTKDNPNTSINDSFTYLSMVEKLRTNLYKDLTGKEALENYGKDTSRYTIQRAREEMDKVSGPNRTAVAVNLVTSTSSTFVGADVQTRAMLMETVGTGLTLLYGITKELDRFNAVVDDAASKVLDDGDVFKAVVVNQNLTLIVTAEIQKLLPASVITQGLASFTSVSRTKAAVGGLANLNGLGASLTAIAGNVVALNPSGAPGRDSINKAIKRVAVWYPRFMTDLVTALSEISVALPGLVTVTFPRASSTDSTDIRVDFSGLRELVTTLMSQTRAFLDKFSPVLNNAAMKAFDDAFVDLNTKLVSKYLEAGPGEFRSSLLESNRAKLDELPNTIQRVYTELVSYGPDIDVLVANFTGGAGAAEVAAIDTEVGKSKTQEAYGGVLASMVAYNPRAANSGMDAAFLSVALGDMKIPVPQLSSLDILLSGRYTTAGGIITKSEFIPGAVAASWFQVWDPKAGSLAGPGGNPDSLLFQFNRVVGMYLTRFFDAGGQRIYSGLVSPLSNGPMNAQVMNINNNYGFPDVDAGAGGVGAVFGQRGLPTGNGVLAQSIGIMLRNIATTRDRNGVPLFTYETLSEVPIFQKNAMRAYLPVYDKLFSMIQQKGILVRELLQNTAINAAIPYYTANQAGQSNGAGVDPAFIGANNAQLINERGSNETRTTLVAVIDSINSALYTLKTSCDNIKQELVDSPKYMETDDNAIAMITARTGKMPLMPLSLLLAPLASVSSAQKVSAPVFEAGTTGYKFAYGTRGVLGYSADSSLSLDDMPGVKEMLSQFNSSGSVTIDEQGMTAFVNTAVKAIRFLDNKFGYLMPLRTVAASPGVPVAPLGALGVVSAAPVESPVDYTTATAQEQAVFPKLLEKPDATDVAIQIVEVLPADRELVNIANKVKSVGDKDVGNATVESEDINNIISLNVMPINVNGLMRSVGLVNLMNYSHTFDDMVCEIFAVRPDAIEGKGLDDKEIGNSTRKALVKLLVDPYCETTLPSFGSAWRDGGAAGAVGRILRGDTSVGIGRPRFLSDQLTKALLVSLPLSQPRGDQAGPAATAASARGAAVEIASAAAAAAQAVGVGNGNAVGVAVDADKAGNNPQDIAAVLSGLAIAEFLKDKDNLVNDLTIAQHVVAGLIAAADSVGDLAVAGTTVAALMVAARGATGPVATSAVNIQAFKPPKAMVNKVAAAVTAAPSAATIEAAYKVAINHVYDIIVDAIGSVGSPGSAVRIGPIDTRIKTLNELKAGNNDLRGDQAGKVEKYPLGPGFIKDSAQYLEMATMQRWNTSIARNLTFITLLQRVMRLKLGLELSSVRDIIEASHNAVNPSITEYGVGMNDQNQTFNHHFWNPTGK